MPKRFVDHLYPGIICKINAEYKNLRHKELGKEMALYIDLYDKNMYSIFIQRGNPIYYCKHGVLEKVIVKDFTIKYNKISSLSVYVYKETVETEPVCFTIDKSEIYAVLFYWSDYIIVKNEIPKEDM
jgi:hypothetical protein